MELREMIMELASRTGPSGFECRAAERARELLEPFADEISTDVLGNLIAVRRCGEANAPLVLLDAHMDEVGLIVTGYEGGFLRFSNIGGVDARILPAAEVLLLTADGPLRGVIDVMPPHVLTAEEKEKPLPIDKLFIDAGFTDEETASKRVPRGTAVSYAAPCFAMGENLLCGKSLDDRSCAAVLIRSMQLLSGRKLAVDVAVNLAAQEEVGGLQDRLRRAHRGGPGGDPERVGQTDRSGGEKGDPLRDRSPGRIQRHRRRRYPRIPLGRGHGRGVSAAPLYAHAG